MITRIAFFGAERVLLSNSNRSVKLKLAFLFAFKLVFIITLSAQVGISSTAITPHSSSILELRSTTLGFLPPRMTTTERDAISSPATGLVIYNTTTNLLNFYNGSSWQMSASGSVSSVSVTTANGISGSVANATTTPAITLTLGAITPTSVTATGTVTGSNLSGTNTGDQTTVTGNAGSATLTGITDDNSSNATMYPTWVSTESGNQAQKVSSTKLSFNPFTGTLTSTAFSGNLTGNVTGNASTVTTNANLTGDVTSVGNATTIGANKVSNSMLAQMPANTFKGNNTGIAATPLDLNVTQATAMLNTFTPTLKGLVPFSGGGTSNFLRADGTWAMPPGGGGTGTVTDVSVATANGFGGIVSNSTTIPEITLSTNITGIITGNGTSLSAATPGSDYSAGTAALGTGILNSTTGTGNITIAVASDFPTLNQNTTGNAATVTTNANLTGPVTSIGNATTITANAVTNSNLSQIATQTFKGRTSAGTGNVEDMTVAQAKTLLGITGTNSGDQTITLTGEVTGSGTSSFPTTISANAVTNSKLAQIATQTFKGRTTAGTGIVEDLTVPQVKTLLNLTGTNSGDQTITLTGDVTGSGTSSFPSTISANAVTYGKIQNVTATNKVLGRTTAGAGIIEEISTTGSGNVVRATSPVLVTPTGIVKSDVGLGNVDNTSDANKPVSTATQTALNLKINSTDKGANNGVASLDGGGKVPLTQLPTGALIYKGTWNASTNTPAISDATGSNGWLYKVDAGGTQNLGSGPIIFAIGDEAIHNGTIWQKAPTTVSVTSVNTQTGVVVLNSSHIAEVTNLYYTDTRARLAHSVTAPLVYNSGTGNFSISQSSEIENGYLSSTDWATFNGKQTSGNYITTLTGDVTATGPGSVGAIIANNAVTYGKMQAVTPNKLLGSGLSGTAVSEITLGTGLSFTGTTLNSTSSGGTVTDITVVNANGFSGSVANPTTSPDITLSTPVIGIIKGDGTSISAAVAGDFPILNQNTTGNAATVTTNANLTGDITSLGNATTIGTGKVTNNMLAGSIDLTTKVINTLPVSNGGTGQSAALVPGGIMYGSTTTAQAVTTAGTTGQYLKSGGTGAPTWVSGENIVTLGSDVINNNATANTIANVTGLSFPVTAGVTYRFSALIIYTSAATNTGSRWSVSGPASPTLLAYTSQYSLTATTVTNNNASAYDIPAAANATSGTTTGNIVLINGIIKPSANGTLIIRFASEVASSAITAKAGSTLTWW